ncbi:CAP domain-containing protein [Streptomyces sp. NPDC048606]|uniref:CAP domain-containing protein n=1 Tax=Streptomyces sp. NPDC048606 TaxID=3154726 RepID=UPI003437970A
MGRHRLPSPPQGGGRRRAVVRGGLLGVSVAVALGTAAVTTGFVPVGGSFPYVGTDSASEPQARPKPSASAAGRAPVEQGGLANLSGRASGGPNPVGPSASKAPSASASASASASPSASPSPSASGSSSPATSPSPAASPVAGEPTKAPVKEPAKEPERPPTTQAPRPPAPKPPAPKPSASPSPSASESAPADGQAAEAAAVLALVNQERAQAGCVAVRANPPLAALAGAFSRDMAARGFFDHTDPDGNTPWKRAENAGIGGLGGENIARGQGDAASVMRAWMNSPGHKANILNCEFRTMGVGVHFGAGGPWWTQEFGF